MRAFFFDTKMSKCAHCSANGACVQCAQCQSAVYCDAECARSHWKDTHQYECRTPIGVPIFFEKGYHMLIISIRNGGITLDDIAAQLEATPNYMITFFQWLKDVNISNTIIEALGQPSVAHLLSALLIEAVDKNYVYVTNTLVQNPLILDATLLFTFISACNTGNLVLVNLILQTGRVDATQQDNFAFTCAIRSGNIDLVRRLLEIPGVDPSTHAQDPIRIAAYRGFTAIVELLLTYPGVDVNASFGTPLHNAARQGHVDTVALLMKNNNIQPGLIHNNYRSAIACAAFSGNIRIVDMLLRHPDVDPSVTNNLAIQHASAKGHTGVVSMLLKDDRVDPLSKGCIVLAAENGHAGVVSLLLRDPRIPEHLATSALLEASRNGHADVVAILLHDGKADPAYHQTYAFDEACRYGHVDVVVLLLRDPRLFQSDKNTTNEIALAVRYGSTDVVQVLLEDGRFSPNVEDNAPLIMALMKRRVPILKLLLNDPRVIVNDKRVYTMLESATTRGDTEVVELLLKDPRLIMSLDRAFDTRATKLKKNREAMHQLWTNYIVKLQRLQGNNNNNNNNNNGDMEPPKKLMKDYMDI